MNQTRTEKYKTPVIAILIFVLLMSLLVYATLNDNDNFSLFGGADGSEIMYVADDTLDRIISRAILDSNTRTGGETNGEGHLVLGTENDKEILTVYALTQYGEYEFKNSHLVRTDNAVVTPAVIRYRISGNETYNFLNIVYPDADDYTNSVNALFPEKYVSRVLSVSSDDADILKDIEEIYAKVYLQTINRHADVGEPDDFDYIYLSDIGISEDVISAMKTNYSQYPTYIGSLEKLSDNIRYVYETSYNSAENTITLKTYEYGKNDLAQVISLDAATGLVKETDDQQ